MPIATSAASQRADVSLLLEELTGGFRQVLSLMTMREWPLQALETESPDSSGWLQWRQSFTGPVSGVVWIAAPEATWKQIAHEVDVATGAAAESQGDWRAQCGEVCAQASACLLRRLEGATREPANLAAGTFEIASDESGHFVLHGLDVGKGPPSLVRFGVAMGDESVVTAPTATVNKHSASLDLLMEVELPVSVSFGRTQMRLKDAVRLSTGSIVELNKSLSEPVEIIVNNCVIARGEVVVVEGNYGVRIKEIVSREERLRTLF